MKRATFMLALAGSCLLFAAMACAAEELKPVDGVAGLATMPAGINRKLLGSGQYTTDQWGTQWQTNDYGQWLWKDYKGKWNNCYEQGTWKPEWHDKYCYDYQDHWGTYWKKDHSDGHWCWKYQNSYWVKCPETAPSCSDEWHTTYCYDQIDSHGRCWRKESDNYWSCKQSYSCYSCGWTKTKCQGDWSSIVVEINLNLNLSVLIGGLGGSSGGGGNGGGYQQSRSSSGGGLTKTVTGLVSGLGL